jgi:FlaA1/EpsC-like NDP-sugar epimerase
MLNQIRGRVLELPHRWKQAILIVFDLVTLSLVQWASTSLRLDIWYAPSSFEQWAITIGAPLLTIPVFIRLGLYRAIVRYLPERIMWTILQAMVISTVILVLIAFITQMVPRSVPIIYFGIGTLVIAGSRFTAKWLFVPKNHRHAPKSATVLMFGTGEAGQQLAHSIRGTHRVVGFLDDDSTHHGRELAGVRVYDPSRMEELVTQHGVTDLILSLASMTPARRREIALLAGKHGLKVRAMPPIADLATGKYLVSQIREIDVVDLLGRSSVPPDPELIRNMVVDRSIMVTGAGGSIGSELCRRIAQWRPKKLVLFEASEFALYQIEQELVDTPDVVIVPLLGSVTDEARIGRALSEHKVQVVFHAAAHKHVPLVEANPREGIKNNVFGTRTVAEAAFAHGVNHFVLISTDKAVRPTNVMGATKRWAELIVSSVAERARDAGTGQHFCTVRFGNVLGSNGSVVPLFKKQIAMGGPVTLTDAAMTRYFMSIQEAAELIVQAGALSEGGDVFLLDMGEPVLISDLAENMIRLAGLTVRTGDNPDGDIEIAVVGMRPSEKLYEELFYDANSALSTRHSKIMRAVVGRKAKSIAEPIEEMRGLLESASEDDIRALLFRIVEQSGSK